MVILQYSAASTSQHATIGCSGDSSIWVHGKLPYLPADSPHITVFWLTTNPELALAVSSFIVTLVELTREENGNKWRIGLFCLFYLPFRCLPSVLPIPPVTIVPLNLWTALERSHHILFFVALVLGIESSHPNICLHLLMAMKTCYLLFLALGFLFRPGKSSVKFWT